MMNTILLTLILTVSGIVALVWLAFALARQIRRRRLLDNLGVVSEHWLTVHRGERW